MESITKAHKLVKKLAQMELRNGSLRWNLEMEPDTNVLKTICLEIKTDIYVWFTVCPEKGFKSEMYYTIQDHGTHEIISVLMNIFIEVDEYFFLLLDAFLKES
jgi:hypothetical protein